MIMDDKYRCLTCNTPLTKEEYEEHTRHGHTTLEYIIEIKKDKKK